MDRYEVLTELGSGATGVVYRVRHTTLGTIHALKVLAWAHPQLQARLLSEGRAQASVHHENIVMVTDLLEVDGLPALLMEVVDGCDLEEWLEHQEPSVAEVEGLFRQILDGVAAAHSRGIVHRDLKPANVLMARDGDRWVPKVTDFGLAKWVEGDLGLTNTGITMGTPHYMAPEQIRNAREVDHRADIFALGCLLYQMLSGRLPHDGPDALAVLNTVASGDVPPIEQVCPDVPPRLAHVVRASMAVDPDDRLQTCADVRACLDGTRVPLGRGRGRRRVPPSLVRTVFLAASVVVASGLVLAAAWTLPKAAPVVRIVEAPRPEPVEAPPAVVTGETLAHDDMDATLAWGPPPDRSDEASAPDADGYTSPARPTPEEPVAGSPTAPSRAPEAVPKRPATRAPGCGTAPLWLPLPRLSRAQAGGTWSVRRASDLHTNPVESAETVRCTLPAGAEIAVRREPVRVDGRRWLRVAPSDVTLDP